MGEPGCVVKEGTGTNTNCWNGFTETWRYGPARQELAFCWQIKVRYWRGLAAVRPRVCASVAISVPHLPVAVQLHVARHLPIWHGIWGLLEFENLEVHTFAFVRHDVEWIHRAGWPASLVTTNNTELSWEMIFIQLTRASTEARIHIYSQTTSLQF